MTPSPGAVNIWNVDPTAMKAYNDAYWLGQPAEVRTLQNMPMESRPAAALALAKAGFLIDVEIMVVGGSPYLLMIERQRDGYTWVPSAFQPSIGAPNQSNPAVVQNPPYSPYDPANPPSGSIKVTTTPLAPFDPPVPQTPVNAPSPVGSDTGVTFPYGASELEAFNVANGQVYPEGFTYVDPRGKFLFHTVGPTLFTSRYSVWLKIA